MLLLVVLFDMIMMEYSIILILVVKFLGVQILIYAAMNGVASKKLQKHTNSSK